MSIRFKIKATIICVLVGTFSYPAIAEDNYRNLKTWRLTGYKGSKIPHTGFVIGHSKLKQKIGRISDIFESNNYKGFRAIPLDARGIFEGALIADGVPRMDVFKKLSSKKGVLQVLEKIEKVNPKTIWYISESKKIPRKVFQHKVPIVTFQSDLKNISQDADNSDLKLDPDEAKFLEARKKFWGVNAKLYNSIMAYQLEKWGSKLICPPGRKCCPPGMKDCGKPPPCPKHWLAICPPSLDRVP